MCTAVISSAAYRFRLFAVSSMESDTIKSFGAVLIHGIQQWDHIYHLISNLQHLKLWCSPDRHHGLSILHFCPPASDFRSCSRCSLFPDISPVPARIVKLMIPKTGLMASATAGCIFILICSIARKYYVSNTTCATEYFSDFESISSQVQWVGAVMNCVLFRSKPDSRRSYRFRV